MIIENERYFSWAGQSMSPAVGAIHIMSDFDLTDDDKMILADALELFALWETKCPVPGGSNRITAMVLSMTGEVTIRLEPRVIGQSTNLVLLRWESVRAASRSLPEVSAALKTAIILEELCHGLYMIRDEYLVKETVIQILHQKYPLVSLHGLFPRLYDKDNRRILSSISPPSD